MKALVEIAPFAAVAVVLHLGAFGLATQGGVSSGGDGGAGAITLEGSDPGLAALVEAWERPPDATAPESALAPAPEAPAMAELTPLPTAPPTMATAMPALPLAMDAPAEQAETALPAERRAPLAPMAAPVPLTATAAPDHALAPVLPVATPRAPDLPMMPALTMTSPEASETLLALDTSPPPPQRHAAAPETSPRPPARPDPQAPPVATRAAAAPSAPPAQRAAGSGQQGREGQAGRASETSRAGADTGALVAQWGGGIRAAIQRQQRAPAGRRMRGTVQLRLEVRSDGRLAQVALMQSSGHAALDQAALDAARHARLPAAPAGLSGSFLFNLPVRFDG